MPDNKPNNNGSEHRTVELLEYLEGSSVIVEGPLTGQIYRFSRNVPVQPVDVRDAPWLIATRCFRAI